MNKTYEKTKTAKEPVIYDIYEETEKVKEICSEYGYKVFEQFGCIHIRTIFEAWYIVVHENGCITLMHGNGFGPHPHGWHKQFSRKMTYDKAVQYIKQHEDAKYRGLNVNFTFTKTGAWKPACSY